MADGRPVLIYGNGAVARLVHSFARRHAAIAGFTVDDCVMAGATTFNGLPLHPFSIVETLAPPRECVMLVAVGYRDMNRLRLRKYAEAKAKGYSFTSYIDPALVRHDGVSFGENVIVLDQTSVHPGCRIGDAVFIASNVNLGHDCEIGDGAFVNSGVALGGGCKIGKGAFFGVNACAAHGVTIGDFAMIGAGTLANSDVATGAALVPAAGVAARFNANTFLRLAREAR